MGEAGLTGQEGHHAGAGSGGQGAALPADAIAFDVIQQATHTVLGDQCIAIAQEQNELVAADPAGRLARLAPALQHAGDTGNQGIAGGMTGGVIHQGDVVEVQVDEGQRCRAGGGQQGLDLLLEALAIEQSGQRITAGAKRITRRFDALRMDHVGQQGGQQWKQAQIAEQAQQVAWTAGLGQAGQARAHHAKHQQHAQGVDQDRQPQRQAHGGPDQHAEHQRARPQRVAQAVTGQPAPGKQTEQQGQQSEVAFARAGLSRQHRLRIGRRAWTRRHQQQRAKARKAQRERQPEPHGGIRQALVGQYVAGSGGAMRRREAPGVSFAVRQRGVGLGSMRIGTACEATLGSVSRRCKRRAPCASTACRTVRPRLAGRARPTFSRLLLPSRGSGACAQRLAARLGESRPVWPERDASRSRQF